MRDPSRCTLHELGPETRMKRQRFCGEPLLARAASCRCRRAVKQDTLGLRDTSDSKSSGCLTGSSMTSLISLNLTIETPDHFVGRVRHLFDHHERDERVDFVGKHFVEGVRVGAERNTRGSV